MTIDKAQVKRILVITLSNVGDVILTTPVLRRLAREFPDSRIDVMVGPSGKELFEKDPRIFKVIIYDKHLPIAEKRRLQLKLKKLRYDLVVDLKNTVFPLLLGPKYRTGTIHAAPKTMLHSKDRHLYKLKSLGIEIDDEAYHVHVPKEDEEYALRMVRENNVIDPIVVMNAGAKSHLKRWPAEHFAALSDRLITECRASVVMVGLGEDRDVVDKVLSKTKNRPFDLVDKTNIRQLAALLKKAKLLITNDSAPLHLGCSVGVKVLALFGPTDPRKYGPTGEFDIVMNKKLFCSPCESAVCKYNYECMKLISHEEVFETARMMIEGYE
ncbi:MAG: glycosyltransferase family 9 protein [Candidatus Omnitrophica bacterium]|nr:glycosyltransferase family 9 protein [Candidatus Omnitrophota bacterium]